MNTLIPKNKYEANFWQNKIIYKGNSIEQWMFVDDTDCSYSVSSFGRVRSNGRAIKYENGKLKIVLERFLKIYTDKLKRQRVDLGRRNSKSVHRLVALAFIRNPLNLPCVNHKDGNPSNNNATNLEWCTYSENEQHSYSVLGKVPGMKHLKGYNTSWETDFISFGNKKIRCEKHKTFLEKLETGLIVSELLDENTTPNDIYTFINNLKKEGAIINSELIPNPNYPKGRRVKKFTIVGGYRWQMLTGI